MRQNDFLRLACALGLIALGVHGIRTKRLFIHLGIKPVEGAGAVVGGVAFIAVGLYLALGHAAR